MYEEREIKVLDIDVKSLQRTLRKLGARKVFAGERTFTTLDFLNKLLLRKKKIFRLTNEDKIKLSINYPEKGKRKDIKVFISREKELIDLLKQIGISPIAKVNSRRISYELGKVDLDIDIFPHIPPFLEIDLKHVKIPVLKFIEKLGLQKNKIVQLGTEEIFKYYKLDYFKLFKIK